MGTITRPEKTTSNPGQSDYLLGALVVAAEVNADLDTVYALVNGNIENINIKGNAGIAYSKLNLASQVKNVDIAVSADIDAAKLADASILTGKLHTTPPNQAVSTATIRDNAITGPKMSGGADTTLEQVYSLRNYQTSTISSKETVIQISADNGVWTKVDFSSDLEMTNYQIYGEATKQVLVVAGISGGFWRFDDDSNDSMTAYIAIELDDLAGGVFRLARQGLLHDGILANVGNAEIAAGQWMPLSFWGIGKIPPAQYTVNLKTYSQMQSADDLTITSASSGAIPASTDFVNGYMHMFIGQFSAGPA